MQIPWPAPLHLIGGQQGMILGLLTVSDQE